MTSFIVDSESGAQNPAAIVAGNAAMFTNTLTANGGVYDLTGKTVKVTVRREDDSQTVIDATLEDITVSLADADAGDVMWIMSGTMSGLLMPPTTSSLSATIPYVCVYKVMEDDVESVPLRFLVRLGID